MVPIRVLDSLLVNERWSHSTASVLTAKKDPMAKSSKKSNAISVAVAPMSSYSTIALFQGSTEETWKFVGAARSSRHSAPRWV